MHMFWLAVLTSGNRKAFHLSLFDYVLLVLEEGRRTRQQITNVSGIHRLIDWSHDFLVRGLHIFVLRFRVEHTWRLSSNCFGPA